MHRPTRRAFSLIEAAIVLAIVGLVIGTIWTAAQQVQRNQRVARLSTEIVMLSSYLRHLIPLSDYPTACCSVVSIGNAMAPVLSEKFGYTFQNGNYFLTPDGFQVRLQLQYNNYEGLIFTFSRNNNSFTPEVCTTLLKGLASRLKNAEIGTIQIGSGSTSTLSVPYAASNATCPSDMTYVHFYFRGGVK